MRSRVAVFASGVLGLGAFAAFARATPTGIFSGDVAQFQMLGLTGGLAHANGYPVYITLANLFGLLPIGPLAEASYRMNLFSAVFGGVTVGLLALFVVSERAAADLGRAEREWIGVAAGLVAGLAFALTSLTWALATVALPYTLDTAATLLVLLLIGEWARGARAWSLYAGLLVWGASFGVHQDAVLLAPGLAVLILSRLWAERRNVGIVVPLAALSLVAGIAVYVATWAFQDARNIPYDFTHTLGWIAPDTWIPSMRTPLDRFIFQATAQHGHQMLFALPPAAVIKNFLGYFVGLLFLFTPIGVLLVAVGLVETLRRRPALGLALILTFLAQLAFWLSDDLGDLAKHLLPSYLILALWIGLGAARMLRLVETLVARKSDVHSIRRVLRTAAGLGVAALVGLVLLPGAWTSWPVVAGRAPVDYTSIQEWNVPKNLDAPRAYAHQALSQLPPNAVIFAQWNELFTLAYVAQFQDGRRDILTSNQNHYAKVAAVRQYAAARPTYFEGPPQRWLPAELLGRVSRGSPLYALRQYSATALYRVDVDVKSGRASGTFRRLTRGPDDVTPVISPDGEQITYGFADQDAVGVALLDVSSGATRRVLARPPSPGPNPGVFASRSPGELLLYDANATPPGFAALTVGNRALRPLVPATVVGRNFVYVPRTDEVLYAFGNADPPPAGVVLKARSLVTGAERVVATIDFLKDFLVSPDGRHVVYNRSLYLATPGPANLAPGGEIGLMTIDGTPEKRLRARPRGSASPTLGAWSPDSRLLLFFDADAVPRVMNVETLESWTLLNSPNQPGWYYKEAAWAPDGSFVVMPGVATWQEAQTPRAVGRLP